MELDFNGNFRVNVIFFLPFSPSSLTEILSSLWYGLKDPFTLHKLVDKVVLDCQN